MNNPKDISEVCRNYRLCGYGKIESYVKAVFAQCDHRECNRRIAKLCQIIGSYDFTA